MATDQKVALVTGASSGGGIALGLADDGWDVAVNYNSNTEGADETAQAIRDQGQKAWVLQANVGAVVGVEGRGLVNCVAPGAIEIERTKLEDPDYAGAWGSITPMRRVGQVGDVVC